MPQALSSMACWWPGKPESPRGFRLQAFGLTEGPHHHYVIALVGIHFGVEMAHFVGGDFPAKAGERGTKLRKSRQGLSPHDGYGIIGRKIMAIIFKDGEMQRIDQSIGGIAGDHVDLLIDKGAIDQAEVHYAGLRREM